MRESIHAACVDIQGVGVLILGESGAGKTNLAIELMGRGAKLVADDQVVLEVCHGCLSACAPKPLSGLCELTGFGVVDVTPKAVKQTIVRLVLECVSAVDFERMPDKKDNLIMGVSLPAFPVDATHYALPAKILLLAEIFRVNLTLPLVESVRQAS